MTSRHTRLGVLRAGRESGPRWSGSKPATITLAAVGTDVSRNRAEVQIISSRPHAVAIARRLLGPKFIVQLAARHPFRIVCGAPDLVTVSRDGMRLRMDLGTSGSVKVVSPFLVEEADRVRVAVILRTPTTFLTLDLVHRSVEASLSAPVGDREVVFAGSGEPLKVRRPG